MIAGFLAVLEIKPARFPVAAVEKQCGKAVFHLPPAVGSAEEQKVIASVAAVDPQPLIIRLGKDTVFQISDGSQGKAFAPEDILSVELLASFARHDFLLVLHDEKAIMPASMELCGEYGEEGLFAGVPCVIGENGVEQVVELPLTADEKATFHACCEGIRHNMEHLKEI